MTDTKTITLTLTEEQFELLYNTVYNASTDKELFAVENCEDGSHLQKLYQDDADTLYNIAETIEDKLKGVIPNV